MDQRGATNSEAEQISIRDAGVRAGVQAATVRRWVREGRLQGFKKGSRTFVLMSELEALDGQLQAVSAICTSSRRPTSFRGMTKSIERPRGAGSIKATDKGYSARIRANGKQLHKRFATARDAHAWLDGIIDAKQRGTSEIPTIGDIYEWWFATLQIAPQTRKAYAHKCSHFVDKYGSLRADQLTREKTREVWAHLAQIPSLTASIDGTYTRAYTQRLFRQMLKWAATEGYLAANPTTGMAVVKEPTKPPRERALSSTDYERLMTYIRENPCSATQHANHKCSFRWLLGLHGLRQGEVHALRWEDFILGEEPYLIIRRSVRYDDRGNPYVVDDTKTGAAGFGQIPLLPTTVEALEHHRAAQTPPSPWVFASSRDPEQHKTKTGERGQWTRLKREIGLPASTRIHDLRHTTATRLAARNLKAAQDVLRHRDISTTSRYLHPDAATLREALRASQEV